MSIRRKIGKTGISAASLFAAASLCALSLTAAQAQVTLTIGKGSALPPATGSPVTVNLDNPDDKVAAVQVDICDADGFLACAGCETTDRSSGFNCSYSEQANGCCRIVLFSLSDMIIENGTGSIARVLFQVSGGATGCTVLDPRGIAVSNDMQVPLTVTAEAGGFCFPCTADADCNDGLYCTGVESCAGNACVLDTNPCSEQTVCVEAADACVASSTTTSRPSSTTTTGLSTTTTTPDSSTTTTGPSSTTTTVSGDASIEVIADNIWKSPWVALPKLLVIEGSETNFQPFTTKVAYNPRDAVLKFFPIVWSDNYIWNLILVMPSWFAGNGDQEVTVTVTTGGEIASDDFLIQELSFIRDRK